MDRFTAWKAAERFVAKFFSFLFNNTSACYLVFAFFFPTLLAFILLLWFDEYCNVEFIQSFCWLYSVPNLQVIQYLETLYLDGNHVKVVWESVKKSSKCALKKSLVTGSHDWRVAKGGTYVKHVGSWRVAIVGALQDKKYGFAWQLTCDSNLRLVPVARMPCFAETDFSHSSHTLL